MATTDSRPSVRLPWAADRPTADEAPVDAEPVGSTHDLATAEPIEAMDESSPAASPSPGWQAGGAGGNPTSSAPPGPEATGPVTLRSAADERGGRVEAPVEPPKDTRPRFPTPPTPGRRRSNAFLAELARAMHAAAHEARERVLEQFRAESKAFVEELHSRSAEEAAALRRAADEDIAAIREWSKAEIARIREETERRIADRKAALEAAIEDQAARIESQIERLQAAVAGFEAQMDRFFETLLAVDDPTEFAAVAANLPEPPPFEEILASPDAASTPAIEANSVEQAPPSEPSPGWSAPDAATLEAAFAEIEAAARAAELAEEESGAAPAPETAGATEAMPAPAMRESSGETARAASDTATGAAAAESERLGPRGDERGDELEALDEAEIAARLGLSASHEDELTPPREPVRTQLAVVGLVSVASIAAFKRQLANLRGVHAVAVASGPNGEFLFTATHDPELDLGAVVPGLPGFGARITEATEGRLAVTARDPDLSS